MSQSPTLDSTSDEIRAYDVGWAATNKLIRAGRSFSGRERNCCFLNLGAGKRFANVSAPSGLDFADDGRGLALSDWDHDGRVDLWLMNRTGPRVRFMRNELETGNHFVAVKLEGASANRSAIGARVRVHLRGGGPPLVKSLYAGSGYLSQSSKWLHFGLGAGDAAIEAVEVRWPTGDGSARAERFTGLELDGQFILTHGAGVARRWEPPPVDAGLFAKPGEDGAPVPAAAAGGRVVILNPAPLPAGLILTDTHGEQLPISQWFGQPFVLNLWATWCGNCRHEMQDWAAEREQLAAAGLTVLSLCVDEPGADRAADLARSKEVAAQLGYPFPIGLAGSALIENLNALQRAFIGRQSDLPLPSTILIDGAGRAAVIYKGPVSARELARDAALLGARPSEILAAAVPFEGKWLAPPGGGHPRSVALKLTESGLLDDARSYLEQVMPLYADPGSPPAGMSESQGRDELAEIYRFVGAIHHQQEHLSEAEAHYAKSLQIIPDQEAVREELVRLYLARGERKKAADQLQAMLGPDRADFEHLAQLAQLKAELGHPQDAIALYRESLGRREHPDSHNALGDLLRDRSLGEAAAAHYASALEARPGWPLPANNLAWILATHPDENIRDGAEAKRLATLACEATGFRIPPILGTLAAAHAELDEFEAAAKVCLQAIEAAEAFGKPDLATSMRSKLNLYREGRAARDPTLVGGQD